MGAMRSAVLVLEGASLALGSRRVLDGLAFSVRRGECFGLLGPSGAGKTTAIGLLTRRFAADTGRIALFGRPLEDADAGTFDRVGVLPESRALYGRLSIEGNLRLHARIRGRGERAIPDLLERAGLARDRAAPARSCPQGIRRRVELLCAIVHEPELVLLDEPTRSLDPVARAAVHRTLRGLKRAGATLLIATRDAAEASALCDRVAIMDEGRIVALGSPASLTMEHAHPRLVVTTRTRGTIELAGDASSAETVRALLAAGEVVSIHSDEPDLADVLLELTGREL